MSEIKWSPEQLKIIESRGRNLLVSAAAGAGKTTVMIERVIGLIAGDKDCIDVDKLLIVTFTRDAASHMREKLSTRLTELLDADPGNKRLTRQQMLLQNARITTIDSFCNSVVKEFFYRIDIDPSFRIADKAEMALLKNKVLDELLEGKFAAPDPGFLMLVESYCGTRNDEKLNKLVQDLTAASYAQAWPAEWLRELKNDLSADIGAVKLRDEWKKDIIDICKGPLTGADAISMQALDLARNEAQRLISAGELDPSDDRLQKFIGILATEKDAIDRLFTLSGYDAFANAIVSIDFARLTIPKSFSGTAQNEIKKARDKYKAVIKKVIEKWFSDTEEEQASACSAAAGPLCVLIELTVEYIARLVAAKKEKNVFEFSDISHFALEILAQRQEDGTIVPTDAALELRERFHDIFIDEYQDSDAVQEQIAEVIAGSSGQKPYTFMVGDVKQSIYKFRMARPELFIGRSKRYTENPGEGELIHLGLNYRSSRAVIDSVNDVFRLCMHEETGKVEYDKQSELVCGKVAAAGTENPDDSTSGTAENAEASECGEKACAEDISLKMEKLSCTDITEIIIAERKSADESSSVTDTATEGNDKESMFPAGRADEGENRTLAGRADDTEDPASAGESGDEENYTSAGICAEAAAARIKKLIDGAYQIRNKDNTTRNITFGDIVILLRSTSTSAELYKDALENLGIPAFTDSGRGFLNAYEISVAVNYLRLLDNPFQDIPLVSVLRSVIGGMDDDELARIRIFGGFSLRFWQCVEKYADNGPVGYLKAKCRRFLETYSEIRRMNMTRDIDKVIFAIYEKTGFYLYCSALPGGDSRTSNLDLLLSYASQYENGSNSGLFDFVGYIEEITRAEDDLEEAVSNEAANAVRIMTIHKSKGLEFPVVILGDAAKQFNLKDRDREVVISPDYGIASKCILLDKRIKCNTVRRTLLANMIEKDTIGEELRLLYVAMTRAMQKLIIIGSPGKKGKKKEDWIAAAANAGMRYPDHYTASAGGYMDLLYPAALLNENDFLISDVTVSAKENNEHSAALSERRAAFEGLSICGDEADKQICEELDYVYEQDAAADLPVKLSVSDIKHEGMEEEGVSTPWRNSHRKEAEREGAYSKTPKPGADDSNKTIKPGADDSDKTSKPGAGADDTSKTIKPGSAAGDTVKTAISGAELGSLYHKVMQFIPFDLSGRDEVSHFLNGMAGLEQNEACERKHCYAIISPAERAALDDNRFAGFLATDLCKRMQVADRQGMLYREQPFMLGKKACEIYPDRYPGCEELIPVQGIIDCMFEEEDGFVILDYKTDLVEEGTELVRRYHKQLELYAQAASQILGRNVKERVLYSFELDECIKLP